MADPRPPRMTLNVDPEFRRAIDRVYPYMMRERYGRIDTKQDGIRAAMIGLAAWLNEHDDLGPILPKFNDRNKDNTTP